MNERELGQKISELRKAKGLTQEELAARCKINVRSLQRIEAGEVIPRSHTVRTILLELDVDYADFCTQFHADQDNRDEVIRVPHERLDSLKRAIQSWSFGVYIGLLLVFGILIKFGMPWYMYVLPVLVIYLIKTNEQESEAN